MKFKIGDLLKTFGLAILFIVSLLFFTYVTFPYGVLKEAVTAQISKATGLMIRIDEFGPDLPLGFEATNVKVMQASGGPAVELKNAQVHISLLNFLIGKLAISSYLETKNGGSLEVVTKFGLFGLLFDKNLIPSRVILEAEKFSIGPALSFILSREASSPQVNPLISGLLTKINLKGNLQGKADIDLDVNNPSQSSGHIDLQLKDASLKVDDPSLNLADQVFKKANIKAQIESGTFTLEKVSGFHTQELVSNFNGTIKLNQQFPRSVLDVGLEIELKEGLKEQFGFLIDMAGGNGGSLKYRVKGTMGSPNLVPL